jgi:hypothetical protein
MITLRHTTVGRTPLDDRSDSRRNLYLTTCNIHKRQITTALAGFEPVIPTTEQQQTGRILGLDLLSEIKTYLLK